MRLIDADALYAKLQEHEELARKRVWDTASTLPFPNNLNPAYTRYLAQLDERTALKHMVADAPTIEQPEIIRCRDCEYWMPYDWMFSEVWKSKNMEDYPENEIGCMYADMSMSATDFCSRSARREVSE